MQRHIYPPPRVTDYGSVVAMAADFGLLIPGAQGGTSLSVPVAPESGGTLGEEVAGGGAPEAGGGPGDSGEAGVGGVSGGGGGGAGTVSGAELGGASGAERGEHPFTGFPAALVAAVGGTLTAVGAALARAVRRDR